MRNGSPFGMPRTRTPRTRAWIFRSRGGCICHLCLRPVMERGEREGSALRTSAASAPSSTVVGRQGIDPCSLA